MNIFLVQRFNYDAVLARYHSSDRIVRGLGGVVERLMAPVLKTGRAQALVGSNPTPSAISKIAALIAGSPRTPWPSHRDENRRFDWWGALRARVKSEALTPEPTRSVG